MLSKTFGLQLTEPFLFYFIFFAHICRHELSIIDSDFNFDHDRKNKTCPVCQYNKPSCRLPVSSVVRDTPIPFYFRPDHEDRRLTRRVTLRRPKSIQLVMKNRNGNYVLCVNLNTDGRKDSLRYQLKAILLRILTGLLQFELNHPG